MLYYCKPELTTQNFSIQKICSCIAIAAWIWKGTTNVLCIRQILHLLLLWGEKNCSNGRLGWGYFPWRRDEIVSRGEGKANVFRCQAQSPDNMKRNIGSASPVWCETAINQQRALMARSVKEERRGSSKEKVQRGADLRKGVRVKIQHKDFNKLSLTHRSNMFGKTSRPHFSGEINECLHQISCQFIWYLLRHFNLTHQCEPH